MFELHKEIRDGDFTKTIYTLIKNSRYTEAIKVLHSIADSNTTRAGLSLLAYCYFCTQDYTTAAGYYEQLSQMHPTGGGYRLRHAQALYHACSYGEAYEIALSHQTADSRRLMAAIKYAEEDLTAARVLLDETQEDAEANLGCLLYKEAKYEEALSVFQACLQTLGFRPHLSYSVALCCYRLKEYGAALRHCAEIIERGIREHPELSVGAQTEGLEVRSVGNTITLHETALTEAFNLKAAVEYQMRNLPAAREALTDMPPRAEHELDAVTLHNQALMNMDRSPSEGFEKLQFLLQQNPFPPETFANLLLLYCRYDCYDLAADVLVENTHLTYKYLTPYLYEFLDALITQQTAPTDAYKKLDELANQHTDQLRKLAKRVQELKEAGSSETLLLKRAVLDYEELLDRYIPILMNQAKIYWDLNNYSQVEKIFRKGVEFCNDNDVWRLNVAHVLFMQENKFKEAIGFYEPLVKNNADSILEINAVVLANLCVSYIMTSQNEEAEELMRKIEKEEDQVAFEDGDKKCFHLCIVNLVIGTLYCSKGNYEFGISRIMKSMEPFSKKLGTDTWFYAKRCFLSLLENLAKHMIVVRDAVIEECIVFLENCEIYGKNVRTSVSIFPEDYLEVDFPGRCTVSYEARKIKHLLLKLNDY